MVKQPPVRPSASGQQTVRFLTVDEEKYRRIQTAIELLGYPVVPGETIEGVVEGVEDTEETNDIFVVAAQTKRREQLLKTVSILARTVDQPIILVTGALPEGDRLRVLRMGITAILENTLSARELALRISRIVSTLHSSEKETVAHGVFSLGEDKLEINDTTHKTYLNGDYLRLTETEWRILHHLASRALAIVARDQLVRGCMGYDDGGAYLRSLDAHIKNLRRKLGRPDWIETVRGYGYQFVGHVVQPLQ